jgi:hypothetical protein
MTLRSMDGRLTTVPSTRTSSSPFVGVLSEGAMPGYLDMFLTFARFQTIATGNRVHGDIEIQFEA